MEQSDYSTFCDQYRKIFAQNGLERFCTEHLIASFGAFTELLCQVNSHTNLTAIRTIPEIIAKHYADCLLAEPFFPQNATVLDVGCGGGFPCVPLAITRPDLQITAIDSTAKKIAFVQAAAAAQRLSNLNPLCVRAEDPSMARYKQFFSIGTSRAVARLAILAELVLPYIKIGGVLVALKGASGQEEAKEAESAVHTLGGEIADIHETVLKFGDTSESRSIIVVQKAKEAPQQYPRPYAAILKKPL
ncbi:MAG TPA: 16S rRNA (guanine(527)-N(7))-methyltransferase RsmG [Clostridiales bacterium]|nr:16S rRNA (guanine(527)-N(7))-methyltransferase RsmG [Clostridiales bacterium]